MCGTNSKYIHITIIYELNVTKRVSEPSERCFGCCSVQGEGRGPSSDRRRALWEEKMNLGKGVGK